MPRIVLTFWSNTNESLFLEKCELEDVSVENFGSFSYAVDEGAREIIEYATQELGATYADVD